MRPAQRIQNNFMAPSLTSPRNSTPNGQAAPQHYENFPVASWLCPPPLRPPIAAIYAFARTADDIADEGDASPSQRLADLAAMRADLQRTSAGELHSDRWPEVFERLGPQLQQFKLPLDLLLDLLDAFEQDIAKSRDHAGYRTHEELLDYCRRSANPIGRLLLHLYQVNDETSLQMSDNICSALQLINFWQDLSRDLPLGRYYLPGEDCARFNVASSQLTYLHATAAPVVSLIRAQVDRAKALMLAGAPLVKRLPGRAGWELRLVVQGGLRIIEKIENLNYATLATRPKITAWDAPLMFWRALFM